MPAHGTHRRPRRRPVLRGLALVGTGGAALALPLIAPAAAGAATVSGAPEIAAKTVTAPAAPVAAKAAAKAPAAPAAARTYTVVSGDSLSLIAQKKGIQSGWKGLYSANRSVVGDNPSLIHPGLELTLRPGSVKAAAPTKAKKADTTERASRSERRSAAPAAGAGASAAAPAAAAAPVKAAPVAATQYANNLDGWIRQSLDIMAQRGIPGSYDGIHRNIMRESSGNPQAINLWDSNAVAGTPSKGLLQVIEPTFLAYHVPGTSMDLFDPVANITAACNYAADRYGSIDNVNGAY
ncbi:MULTISPECIES: LysM peptidoglycan-binding domain-containing protein [unclassified Streptomyces]|uniref:LysM peptidoglycan-binding domain-containing protein n=1 Tax=unclassified Streptomyces TaxID=2593676 RepID=UPI001E5DB9BB|nr:LysM peptidoglycan-binding domain-containing protein [Streptomyces sp. MBT42]MCD2462349.1 LysM peptidoglycan-binding domain-containing protein [Streptomyces sp. MBT42]